MARLVSSGFEQNTTLNALELSTGRGVSGLSLSTTTVRSGTYAARMNGFSSANDAGFDLQFTTGALNGPLFARTYFRVHTSPSAENSVIGLASSPGAATWRARITVDSGNLLRLYNGAGTQLGSASSALTADTWYRVEIKIDRSLVAGSQIIEAAIDGVVFATDSTQTITTNVGQAFAIGANLNAEAQTAGDWFFDDIAVNDSTGTRQNSYPGSGKLIILRPNAAGDANAFSTQTGGTAGATNNFTRVNEVTPDDATTLNGDNVLNQEDLFNVTDSGIGASDTVNSVEVHARVRNNIADATTAIKYEIEKTSGGTKSQSAAVIPNSTGWKTDITFSNGMQGSVLVLSVDPDGAAWTQATLDTMQIGYKITTGGTNRVEVSNVWAYVDYTPAAAAVPPVGFATKVPQSLNRGANF